MTCKPALVVGARPNFMKAAPLIKELRRFQDRFTPILIHTGQHYDHKLSKLFFDELNMPRPDVYLGVGSGSHAAQTAKIMMALEKTFLEERPDMVIVFGDVNSTLAASVVVSKLCIPLAHVEAGLRSFDNAMPEEINRIVTDRLSDYLFVSEKSGLVNLKQEGTSESKIFFVGNIMIDSLAGNLEKARQSDILDRLGLKPRNYVAMTMHRPANVDSPELLGSILDTVRTIGQKLPVVFPCHPRTRKMIEENNLAEIDDNTSLRILNPLGYLEFLRLQSEAKFVLTDSGGIQEETTYLRIPCLTVRENTERPSTVDIGSNIITGTDSGKILEAAENILAGNGKSGDIPDLWDGHTAERIVEILKKLTL